MHPALFQIELQDPKLVAQSGEINLLEALRHPFAVVRVNRFQPQLRRAFQAFTWQTPNLVERRADIRHLSRRIGGYALKHDENGANILRQLSESLLAFPQ